MSRPGFEADQYQIVVRDLYSGEIRVLTEDWDRSPSSIAFTSDGQAILAVAQDVGHHTLWRFDLDGSEPVKLVDGGAVGGADVAGDDIVYAMNRPRQASSTCSTLKPAAAARSPMSPRAA